ncbi:alpha/beta fold hydrolase [uncultured Roseibium sp.]|uniref:alpha/beta hydrolase n=1 Tax=uncultured Roseibium sp. TaxID=1936171 RepID=UPI00260D417F|nr:alpha/beta fold hydrolase [uncultured Roseibium sp.]
MCRSSFRGMVFAVLLLSIPFTPLTRSHAQEVGRVVQLEVPAPALKGNLLNTPASQGAAVYLPPSYDDGSDRRFPVIYLLHGNFDDYDVWLEHFGVPVILDRMIAAGNIPELIVVMPNGGNRYGGGFYRNSPVSGNWADFISIDLVEFVDEHFQTLSNPVSRAVVGHSMGGYGALNLGMNHPDVFSVVWALSPCCLVPSEDLSFGNEAWQRAFAVTKPEDLQELIASRDFYAIALLGILSAFNPDPDAAPHFGDFPFDVVRGEVVLDDDAFDHYRDAFAARQVRSARDNLRSLRGLGLGVGLGDQFLHITDGTLEFSQQLGAERIPHRLDVYAGDHREQISERLEEAVLPWVAKRLIHED